MYQRVFPRNRFLIGFLFALLFWVAVRHAWGAGPVVAEATDPDTSKAEHIIWMLVYTSVAIIFSFLCSVAEAVMLSVTPSFLAKMKNEGHRSAQLIQSLKQNIDRSLAAILTLNTIAHTVGAGGAGARAAAAFGNDYVTISMIVLTLLILFLSEIIPKTIGAVYWRSLAPITARFIWILIIVLFPLIFVSELLTKLLTKGKSIHGFNREEFTALADIGAAGGHFEKHETNVLKNLFRFAEIHVEDIMTPRTVVFRLQQDLTVSEVIDQHELTFTRIPIYETNSDDVTGFVLKTDLLLNVTKNDGRAKLRDLRRDIAIVDQAEKLSTVFEKLVSQRAHIVLVVDSHGGMQGILTLEDVVETLLGCEIVDEADKDIDMRALARKRWQERMKKLGVDV